MIRIEGTRPVACMLALSVASVAVAAQAHAAPYEPRHASVEIDTSDVGEEGPVIKRRTRERTDVVLRAAGVLPARPNAGDPVIFVDVDELTGTEPGYQCEVWISHLGKVVGERRRVECTLCTESEIVQRVETTVGELIPLLPTEGDAEPTEASPTDVASPTDTGTETETDGSSTTTTPSDDERPKGLGGMGKAGIGLIALGVAGAAAGAVMVALPIEVDPEDPLYEITYRPPGYATLAVGGAALVTGVVLLVVDRRRARPRTTALVPTLGPNTAGLTWSGRF